MRIFIPIPAASLAIVAFLFVLPSRAEAEAITLNQGVVTLDSDGPLAFGFGSSEFGVQQLPLGAIDWAGIGFHMGCASTGGCAPGQLFDFANDTSGSVSFGHGNATVDGSLVGDVQFTGDWHFTSFGARVPTSGAEFVRVTAPFRFSGTMVGRTTDGNQLFDADLTGFGFASVDLERSGTVYVAEEAAELIYQFRGFDPVPEPASLLLLATGAAGVMARRRLTNAGLSR